MFLIRATQKGRPIDSNPTSTLAAVLHRAHCTFESTISWAGSSPPWLRRLLCFTLAAPFLACVIHTSPSRPGRPLLRRPLVGSPPASSCIPIETALAVYPDQVKQFYGFNLNPGFLFTVRSAQDAALYQKLARDGSTVGGFTEGVYIFLDQVLRHAPPGLVYDIGGNFGVTSIFAAKMGHRVVAVEGSPVTASVFKFNTLLNCVQDSVTLLESMVSDRQEMVSFRQAGISGASSAGKLIQAGPDGAARPPAPAGSMVAAQPLDSLLEVPAVRPLVWKLDVEGFEEPAFKGGAGFLSAQPPFYVVWESNLDRLGAVDTLRQHGYTNFYYLGSMMLEQPTNQVQASWIAWTDRPINLTNVAGSVRAWHAGKKGWFDLVAVHRDQVPGCPASVNECKGMQ